MQQGDANTAFFFASMKGKRLQNQITMLVQENGNTIREPRNITEEIVGFYKNLLGQNKDHMPVVRPELLQERPTFDRSQQLNLIKSFTADEVEQALKNVGDSKAPGEDGFNSFFFKKVWLFIGEEVTTAVLDSFQTNIIYAPINRTSVILIPNVQHSITIKDYRPISCCTTIYKFISKMLTNRFQGVIEYLVDPSQAAFVPGRMLTDNVILSDELIKGYGKKGISPICMFKIDMQRLVIQWNDISLRKY